MFRQTHKLDEQRFYAYCVHLRDMYNFEPTAVDSILKEMRVLAANSQYSLGTGSTKLLVGKTGDEKAGARASCAVTIVNGERSNSKKPGTLANGQENSDTDMVAEGLTNRRVTPR